MRPGTLALLVLLPGVAGCDPFAFGDLADEASTRVLEAPDGYPRRGFGRVVIGSEGSLGGEPVSRIAVSGGTDSPFDVYAAWEGGDVPLHGSPLYDGCEDLGDCADGAGAAMAGIPVWRGGSAEEGRVCLLVTAPTAGSYLVRCETGAAAASGELFTGPAAQRLGASAAALPPGSPIGVAVLGAPDAAGAAGTLYRVPDGAGPVEITVDDAIADEVRAPRGKLGEALAAAVHPDGRTLIAAGAPDAGRVVVLSLRATGEAAVVAACLDDPSGGFGAAVAWGDVDGDGLPELFVGGAAAAEGRLEGVRVYGGADLPDPAAPGVCGAWGAPPVDLACPAAARGGLASCAAAGFGASLAVGDVNADGFGDLLVGAPHAEVDGVPGAGAVYLIPGGGGGLEQSGADVLTHSSPASGDELGFTVATVGTHLGGARRVEPVAGAPGRDAVLLFLCTGLANDTPAIGTRCVAR